jgi:hypothetical protein
MTLPATSKAASLAALMVLSASLSAGNVVSTPNGLRFEENFPFSGNHAASIAGGSASTVWWSESDWDARGDSAYSSVTLLNSSINNRFHIDVHKALNADPRDGRLSNTVLQAGGNGSPGVGIMHLDFQDIVSARLRNPMLIGASQASEVTFYAPAFNTTGHWWEVAITPANSVVGAEHTAVPGQGDLAIPGPLVNSTSQPGPGTGPSADSINLVSFGATDVPCDTGWKVRFGVTKSVNGVRSHAVNQVTSLDSLLSIDPAQADRLIHWRIRYLPSGLELAADPEEDGSFSVVESFAIAVPWNEVHVHFMAVAYQADHHPQGNCFLGHIREIAWRNIAVQPVKYAATDVYPKNNNTDHSPSAAWRAYDLRDIQRFGPAVAGLPQPNQSGFAVENSGRYCRDAGFPCFGNVASATLSVTLPARPGMQLTHAAFVYDTKDTQAGNSAAQLRIGTTSPIAMPGHDSVAGADWQTWVRRAVPLNAASIASGTHMLNLSLDTGTYLDRMELELAYTSTGAADTVFSNGYENAAKAVDFFSKRFMRDEQWLRPSDNESSSEGPKRYRYCEH